MDSGIVFFLASVPEGRVFGLDMQTLIGIAIQLFNTGVLAAALSFILYKPVRELMRKRTDRIRAQISSAENDAIEANTLRSQYEEKLKSIEDERIEILEMARKIAAEKSKELLEDAKKEADAVKRRASTDILREQERVRDELKQHIIEVSSAMAGKFVTQVIDRETQDKLFAETLAELEEATWLS